MSAGRPWSAESCSPQAHLVSGPLLLRVWAFDPHPDSLATFLRDLDPVSGRRSSGSSNFTSQQIGSADSWPSQTSSATSRGCWGQAFPSAVTPQGLSWHRRVDTLSPLSMPSIAGTLTFSVVTSSREKMSFSHPNK